MLRALWSVLAWVGPQAERPRFPGPLLRRTRGPDPSSKATLSLGWEDPLEKGKATHSSILAWRIPWPV